MTPTCTCGCNGPAVYHVIGAGYDGKPYDTYVCASAQRYLAECSREFRKPLLSERIKEQR